MTFNGIRFQPRLLGSLGLLMLAAATTGCLNRPVAKTKPETNNVFVKQNPSGGVDKIDILFMIDNSLSMGDKQQVMAAAVPQLLGRLTNPDCVDIDDSDGIDEPRQMPNPTSSCPDNLQREFAPVKDIHIGVVTSALGDFGGDTCPEGSPTSVNQAMNDHAWLLGALERNADLGSDFLSWTGQDAGDYENAIETKKNEFANFVTAATELGCGNEMILEGWYRFLVDPEPPTDVLMENKQTNFRGPKDERILEMRKEFLRPDSLLAIFMLADENDCSMKDQGGDVYSWVAMTQGGQTRMWRGSKPCESDPNDKCCFSCMLGTGDSSCQAKDPDCKFDGPDVNLSAAKDDINVRCRSMKKRFGYDFLFPASRYVNALTKPKLCPYQSYGNLDCECAEAKAKGVACEAGPSFDNPLYQNLKEGYVPTGPMRVGPDSVFLAGVVGVPWQDLAKSLDGSLEYMTASELFKTDGNRWDWFAPKITEDYSTAELKDPFMYESTSPRSGTHPLTGDEILPPETTWGDRNDINGHEWYTSDKDVQFACIFSLNVQLGDVANATRECDLARTCGEEEETDKYKICKQREVGCSCALTETGKDPGPLDPTVSLTPLCQNQQSGYTNKQTFAKAYPGLRELQVLRGYYEATQTDNAIVGSICPKDLNWANRTSSGYGYNPAVKSLVDRLKEKLVGTCLPRSLTVDQETGKVPCAIVEAIPSSADRGWCDCKANRREVVGNELAGAIRGGLEREGICGGATQESCDKFCLCKLVELTEQSGADGTKCLNELNVEKSTNTPGFCYVDPSQDHGAEQVVASCPGTEKRIIRIVGNANTNNKFDAAPAPGRVFIACSGAANDQSSSAASDQ